MSNPINTFKRYNRVYSNSLSIIFQIIVKKRIIRAKFKGNEIYPKGVFKISRGLAVGLTKIEMNVRSSVGHYSKTCPC